MIRMSKTLLAVVLVLSAGTAFAGKGKAPRPRPEYSVSGGPGGGSAQMSFAGNSGDVKNQIKRPFKEAKKGLRKAGIKF